MQYASLVVCFMMGPPKDLSTAIALLFEFYDSLQVKKKKSIWAFLFVCFCLILSSFRIVLLFENGMQNVLQTVEL